MFLQLHVVLSSVPTEAWADPQRDGICGSPLRGGADCGGRALLRTFRGFAFVAPCRIFKLKTDADGAMTQNPC
jgi:hypothetical protein